MALPHVYTVYTTEHLKYTDSKHIQMHLSHIRQQHTYQEWAWTKQMKIWKRKLDTVFLWNTWGLRYPSFAETTLRASVFVPYKSPSFMLYQIWMHSLRFSTCDQSSKGFFVINHTHEHLMSPKINVNYIRLNEISDSFSLTLHDISKINSIFMGKFITYNRFSSKSTNCEHWIIPPISVVIWPYAH